MKEIAIATFKAFDEELTHRVNIEEKGNVNCGEFVVFSLTSEMVVLSMRISISLYQQIPHAEYA